MYIHHDRANINGDHFDITIRRQTTEGLLLFRH